ncbi:MAG: HAD-IC family P-type ATPase [Candidatus Methanomethylophilaceae archaeon]|nr:HAD-IC family P-type ATPase [Candidatus Methanomethylophilaceae archaeon]
MTGLTSAEVAERKARGEVNQSESVTGRSYLDILVKNVATPFNLLLFIIGAALALLGNWISAISATGIIIFNILISTIQEMRAKRRLDKIALLTRPKVTVIRDGQETTVDQDDVVKDDLVVLRSGDQALVDGTLESVNSLEMDESVLTGESHTVRKNAGDPILSGTVCVSGEGMFKVTAFGDDSYANKMLADAKKFVSKSTPLQMETSTITKILMVLAGILIILSLAMELFRGHDIDEILEVMVLCLDVVPIALFLLVTLTYMLAAVRMSKTGVLLQNSNSVESISHVDTVCMDKTGTITTNKLLFESDKPYIEPEEAARLCSLLASATGSRNRTMQAVLAHYGEIDAKADEEIQFSSDRKFSAVRVGDDTIYSGAWNVLEPHCRNTDGVGEYIEEQAKKGLRTIVVCRSDSKTLYEGDEPAIPDLKVANIVSISDEIRPDCRDTIQVFLDNDMEIKVISGDDPVTVDALFSLAGIPGDRRIISGPELDAMSEEEFKDAALNCNIFGRMKPENKEAVIRELKHNGRYVAMIGDGVNDVKSIKTAHVGIALQSGAAAARGVSDMVLMEDSFSSLPKAIVEGRRTVSGMRDILKLYLSRNFALAIMFILVMVCVGYVPMIPIQNTFYAFVAVTVIAFFMTVFAKPEKNRELVLPDVLKFVIPAAITIGALGVLVYAGTWILVDRGDLVVDMEYMLQFVPEDMASTVDELFLMLSWGEPSMSEICARSAMVLTVSVAGVLQLVLICPPFKFLSYDGRINRSILPPILMLLMLGLVAAMLLFLKQIAIALCGFVIFPSWYYGVMFGCVIIWLALTLLFLKLDVLHRPVDRFESFYMKRLGTIGDEKKRSPEAPFFPGHVRDDAAAVLDADVLHVRQLVVGNVVFDDVRDYLARLDLPMQGVRAQSEEVRKLPARRIYKCYPGHFLPG